ncbi:peptidoglycan bridge formation glycyltransferase FemA/FemB family protein [bacterium]|nr:MAG: peptidoglycan bridge formation glycyltransferase FemA/FemB family protein [bacterium]
MKTNQWHFCGWLRAGATAYELYGGVNATGQKMRANYALKWRAITDAQNAGLKFYDFNGRVSDGVSQFKEGFGPDEVDFVGTWDRANRAGSLCLVGRSVAGH